MYKANKEFIPPEDEQVKIWRYMDFTKLLSLLESESLFFTRLDKFDDPFEGSFPKANVEARINFLTKLPNEYHSAYLQIIEDMPDNNKNWKRCYAVNCWHENEHESAAMWKLYIKSNEGVAIQSIYDLLKRSIIDETIVHIGKVKYIDYEKDFFNAATTFQAFLHKRKSFEHEKEIRAIVCKLPTEERADGRSVINFKKEAIVNGLNVKVDIKILVQAIYIAPNSPMWFFDLVKSVVSRYNHSFDVIQSELNNSPLF